MTKFSTGPRAPQQAEAYAFNAQIKPVLSLVLAEQACSTEAPAARARRVCDTGLRNLLLGSVAAGMAMIGYGRVAYAACVTDGATITCTGDLTAGVAATNPATTLNVNSLTANITPTASVDGIGFHSATGNVTIVSDTGAFTINATNAGGDGVVGVTSSPGAAVSITHTGDINSEIGHGLYALSATGDVTTVSSGKIQASLRSIFAVGQGLSTVSVTHTGDVTSDQLMGIFAYSAAGNVTTVSTGNIHAYRSGIYARNKGAGAAVGVSHTGDITSTNESGIYARSDVGTVTTVSTGNIQANNQAIYARSDGAGAVSVTHSGDITSAASRGIDAYSASGGVTIVSSGTVHARTTAIHANGSGAGAASVTHTGDVTSTHAEGIYANSDGGGATIVSKGNVRAAAFGLYAIGHDALVSITHTGDVKSENDIGIFAESWRGDIEISSNGNIESNKHGIFAKANVSGDVLVTHTGDITSTTNVGLIAYSEVGSITSLSSGNIQALSSGIALFGAGAGPVSVTHTGDITSTTNFGVFANSVGGSVTTVSAGNFQAHTGGIFVTSGGVGIAGGAVSVTHTGDITSTTNVGVFANSVGGSVTIVSAGNIQAHASGIFAQSGGLGTVDVTHTGNITSATQQGIWATSSGSVALTLTDGVVRGATGAVQATSATGTTLNLNAGSVLIGAITIGGAGAAVLNTGPGLSISHTFTGTVPTIGNVSGNVSAINGNQIAVADISGLSAVDNQLSVTLDGVSGVLAASRDRGNGNWWLSAFGGTGFASETGTAPQAVRGFGGLVAGTHAMLDKGMQLGVFGGLSKGIQTAGVTNGARSDTDTYFGGLYGSFTAEMLSLDFAVAAGGSSNDGTRFVANNTVATGLETAHATYASFFLAPEFTLSSRPVEIQGYSFTPSLRVRYELLQENGFTETGLTSGALTMGEGTSQALNIRLQGAMPVELSNPAETLVARAGFDARFATHSGQQATLLGVVTNGAGAGSEFSDGAFIGVDFTHVLSDFATLTANGELRAGTTGISASANFGIKGGF